MHSKNRLTTALIMGLDMLVYLPLFVFLREYFLSGHLPGADVVSSHRLTWGLPLTLVLLAFLLNRAFIYAGMYRLSHDMPWWKAVRSIGVAATLGTAILVLGGNILGVSGIDIQFSRWFWSISTAVILVFRLFLLGLQKYLSKRKHYYALIVGINNRALSIFKALEHPRANVSFFDLAGGESHSSDIGIDSEKVMVGDLSDLNKMLSDFPLDDVIIALPLRSHYDDTHTIIELCAQQGIRVRLAADLFDLPSKVTRIDMPGDKEQLVLYETNLHPAIHYDVKRAFDIVGSIVGLVLFLPLFLVIPLAILLIDGPPVFFRQERVGFNKRRFKIFKFRTMVREAESLQDELESRNEYGAGAAAFKLGNDPRATRLGNFLRKTSLDELPQLMNVLLGSMSLVGPRPLPTRDFDRFYNDAHRLRFSVKPGITGLWQVGGRNDVEFEEWMGLDVQYTENWSVLLDLKILFKTVFVVLSGKGAK